MLTAMRAGQCTLAEIQRWMCRAPAEAYAIANKGRLVPGFDADLVLVDIENYRPVRDAELYTRVHWSPYAGRQLTGWPVYTFVGGAVVYEHGKIREGIRGKALRFDQAA
jgi:dihydroorotase